MSKKSFFVTPGQYYYARRKAQFAFGQLIIYLIILLVIIGFVQQYFIPILIGGIIIGIIIYFFRQQHKKEAVEAETQKDNVVKQRINACSAQLQSMIDNIKTLKGFVNIQDINKSEYAVIKQNYSVLGERKPILDTGELFITNKRLYFVGKNKNISIKYDNLFKVQLYNDKYCSIYPVNGDIIKISVDNALVIDLFTRVLKKVNNPLVMTDAEIEDIPTFNINIE